MITRASEEKSWPGLELKSAITKTTARQATLGILIGGNGTVEYAPTGHPNDEWVRLG
jgi:hypothetical protein